MSDTQLAHHVSEAIRELRRQRGLTQRQLADALGVSVRTVSRWETAQALPNREQMTAIGLSPALVAQAVSAAVFGTATGGGSGGAVGGLIGGILGVAGLRNWLGTASGELARTRMLHGMLAGAVEALADDLQVPPRAHALALLRFLMLMRAQQVSIEDGIAFLERQFGNGESTP